MKPCFFISFALILLAGCVTPNLTVQTKKQTPKPYSKILVVYIEGGDDLSIFDSITYNICLHSAFIDTNTVAVRTDAETVFADRLSSPRSTFVRSSDYFDTAFNSYENFRDQLDTLGVDAILLVDHFRYYTKVAEQHVAGPPPYGAPGGKIIRKMPNDVFTYYLLEPHKYLPVWKAQQLIPDKNLSHGNLPAIFMKKLEQGLVEGGYIAPHLAIRSATASTDRPETKKTLFFR